MTIHDLHRSMLADPVRLEPPPLGEIGVAAGRALGETPAVFPLARVVAHAPGWVAPAPPERLRLVYVGRFQDVPCA